MIKVWLLFVILTASGNTNDKRAYEVRLGDRSSCERLAARIKQAEARDRVFGAITTSCTEVWVTK